MPAYCAFEAGYLEALAFTDTDNPDSESYGAAFSDELRAQAESDCARFQVEADALLTLAYESGEYDAEQAGRDFWLTRCGHGAGFWDRQLGGTGDKLSEAARAYGNLDVYRGDDGLAYLA